MFTLNNYSCSMLLWLYVCSSDHRRMATPTDEQIKLNQILFTILFLAPILFTPLKGCMNISKQFAERVSFAMAAFAIIINWMMAKSAFKLSMCTKKRTYTQNTKCALRNGDSRQCHRTNYCTLIFLSVASESTVYLT